MKKTQIYTLIAVLVLIVAAGVLFIIQLRHNRPGGSTTPKVQSNQAPAKPVYASAGQFTSGLSKDMILASKPLVSSSYSIAFPNSTQNTAIFSSKDSVATVYNAYLKYMKDNKYTMISSKLSTSQGLLYGYTDQGSLSVQIDATKTGSIPTGSNVILSYLKK